MNDLIARIPKSILVVGVLALSLVLIILNDPLKDECEIQASLFERNTKGILTAVKKNKKIQFAQITNLRDRCKDGNSLGACNDYFQALAKITKELKNFNEQCLLKYHAKNESFVSYLRHGLKILALIAWGDRTPASKADRLGWLTEPEVKTFCQLKKTVVLLLGEEEFLSFRNQIYAEYPDDWPEKAKPSESSDDNRRIEDRPRSMKSSSNPNGKYTKDQIFERSLFSIRCDLFL